MLLGSLALESSLIKQYTLRIHGYKRWYQHIYSKPELDSILTSISKLEADKKAIYFNNDHGMLENGLYMLKKLSS